MTLLKHNLFWVRYFVVLLALVMLSGCAYHYTAATYSEPYGFFSGLWHGIIFPFSLIASIVSWVLSIFGIYFFTEIQIIGRPNTGIFFYYIGFGLGLMAWGGSSAASRN